MSQHWFTNSMGRTVLYGSDKPTGGFFYTEFYRDDEIDEKVDDVVIVKSALTIFELIEELSKNQRYTLSNDEIKNVLTDWATEPNPTPLQQSIGRMFGHNLEEHLQKTKLSIQKYILEKNNDG